MNGGGVVLAALLMVGDGCYMYMTLSYDLIICIHLHRNVYMEKVISNMFDINRYHHCLNHVTCITACLSYVTSIV